LGLRHPDRGSRRGEQSAVRNTTAGKPVMFTCVPLVAKDFIGLSL
jgi:hypothetical protein